MDTDVLAQRMLQDILERMTQFCYVVKPVGIASNLKKIALPIADEEKRSDALEFLEEWLTIGVEPYCALLGEYGMGKTTTCMLFTQKLLEKRKSNPSLPLPIYLDLRNIREKNRCEEMGLIALIDAVLENSPYGGKIEGGLTAKEVIRLVQEESSLIIFDGLDEVLVHLSMVAGQHFTRKLLGILPVKALKASHLDKTRRGGRVLISCRTHYFRTIREQKSHFTAEDRGGILAEDYRAFIVLPFAEGQIREYLAHSLPNFDIDALLALIRSVHNLSEMAERPYTLSLIPSLVPQIERWKMEGSRVTGATVYRHMVVSWLARDAGKHKLTPQHKLQLMEHFAAELWKSSKQVWSVGDVESWLVHFLRARPDVEAQYTLGKGEELLHHILEMLKEDLRTATFLVRVGDADFRFAHTSLQEFFLATYLCNALIQGHFAAWDMAVVSKETLDFLGQLLSEGDEALVLERLADIRDRYQPRISELAFAYMLLAGDKGYPTPLLAGIHLEGANLKDWIIVGKSDQLLDLRGASFQGVNLDGANLRYLNLDSADFSEAQLANAEFIENQAQAACFERANLSGTTFRDMNCPKALFGNAKLYRTQWVRCQLDAVVGLDPMLSDAIFVSCEPFEKFNRVAEVVEEESASFFDGQQAIVNECTFSPDGQYLAAALWDKTLQIWNLTTGECQQILRGHEGCVRSCAFSSDGRQLVSASMDKTLRIWDMLTGECLKVFQGHEGTIRKCAFSSLGQVASASVDKTLRIWDVITSECLHVLKGHTDWVRGCAFSPDGRQLASTSEDKTIRIWDTATGKCLKELSGHAGWVRGCAFSPDGKQLVTTSRDKTLRIWNVATGECLKILSGHEGRTRDCAFSPCGQRVLSASGDQTLRIWDALTGACLHILSGHQGNVNSCGFSPNGLRVASASDDGTLRIWDVVTGECLQILGNEKKSLSVSPPTILSSPQPLLASIDLSAFDAHQDAVSGCTFSSDSEQLISASWDTTLRVWDVATGECLKMLRGHQGRVRDCALSPDDRWLVSISDDHTLRIWNAVTGECHKVLSGHLAEGRSCVFSPDGQSVASTSVDKTLRIWNAITGECLKILAGHEDALGDCEFSPDGTALVSTSEDDALRFWSVKTGECLQILKGHTGRVRSCAFSPNGRKLASVSEDKTLRLWDLVEGECLQVLNHEDGIRDCAFSPDGQQLVSASEDKTLQMWDAKTGKCLRVLSGHKGVIKSCAFSFDGKRLASASADHTLRIWDVVTGACLQVLGRLV